MADLTGTGLAVCHLIVLDFCWQSVDLISITARGRSRGRDPLHAHVFVSCLRLFRFLITTCITQLDAYQSIFSFGERMKLIARLEDLKKKWFKKMGKQKFRYLLKKICRFIPKLGFWDFDWNTKKVINYKVFRNIFLKFF